MIAVGFNVNGSYVIRKRERVTTAYHSGLATLSSLVENVL